MKKNILVIFTLLAVALFGLWMYQVNSTVAAEFRQTYQSFGMTTPAVTSLLFSSLPFWEYIIVIVGFVSLLPIFACAGKLKYISVLIPISLSLLVLLALYLPVFSHGAAI